MEKLISIELRNYIEKNDAEHFVFKNEDLSFYSKELFLQMLDRI